MTTTPIRRALLSVADKTGLEDLAKGLKAQGVDVVSTGGTAALLRAAGLEVKDVSDVTGHPEIMGGRVKTLHPRIHGGILARLPQDEGDMDANGIAPFDLVVVNLYRFEDAVAAGSELPELVEQVDIGGPAMTRAAAKNFARVTVVTSPDQYDALLEELEREGGVTAATRRRLALAAFARTAEYDRSILVGLGQRMGAGEATDLTAAQTAALFASADNVRLDSGQAHVNGRGLPTELRIGGARRGADLRYGENPHQRGALYETGSGCGLSAHRVLEGGKALSYNNLLDVDAALSLAADLPTPGVCVLKHAGPCGAAAGEDRVAAFEAAWQGDPLSAFGSVVGFNAPLTLALAEALVSKGFIEVVVAPAFDEDAVARIRARKGWGRSVRLVVATPPAAPGLRVRSVAGALLVQDADAGEAAKWETVTRRAPTEAEERSLRFGWTCVKHVRSNAIVLAAGSALVGVGGGQPSRVDAVEIAVRKAGQRAKGACLASDAFFPFPDGVEAAHAAGVTAVVQPGGSRKDKDVIARADALGLAMVFTGTRHFRH